MKNEGRKIKEKHGIQNKEEMKRSENKMREWNKI